MLRWQQPMLRRPQGPVPQMSDTDPRRTSTLRLLKQMQDHKLAEVSRLHQQRQAQSDALKDEIYALERRIDQEVETTDAGAAAYLPMFLRAAQKATAKRRMSHAKLADAAKQSEAELHALYRRVTSLRLAADVIAADQVACRTEIQQAQALESMITRHDRKARNHR